MLESRAVKTRRAAANNFRDSGTICLGLNLLLLILLNVFVDVLREVQIAINITGVWIRRVGTDWELLLGLPLANPFRTRWVVVTGLDMDILRFCIRLLFAQLDAESRVSELLWEPSLTRRNPSTLEIHRRHGQSRVLGLRGTGRRGLRFLRKVPG